MNRTLKHLAGFGIAVLGLAGMMVAQTPEAGPALNLTATSANVTGAPDSIRINLLRWSTDAERDQLLSAWMLTDRPAGRGAGARAAGASADTAGSAGQAGPGARAGGRRGGRGGANAAPPPPRTPETSLAAALGRAPTLGYLWSSEVAGYAIRYAVRLPEAGGGERIILLTERRLGAWNDQWKPAGPAAADAGPSNAEFSVIELRLNAKGDGEGKISQNAKLSVDTSAKTLEMENYSAAPVVLKSVKRSKS